MSYEHLVSEVVRGVEAVGAGIMVVGGLGAFLVFASSALQAGKARGPMTPCVGTWAAAFCSASKS